MTKSEYFAGRYLSGVILNGSRNFRYRNRVRSLLGLPKSEGVKLIFGSALSQLDFIYAQPQFTGQFYLPDEFEDQPSHNLTKIQNEFMSLPPAHRDSDLLGTKPGRDISEQKFNLSENGADQTLSTAQSRGTNKKDQSHLPNLSSAMFQMPDQAEMSSLMQSPFPSSPAKLSNVNAQKATMDMPSLPQQHSIQVPHRFKDKSQLLSKSGNEPLASAHKESSGNVAHKAEITNQPHLPSVSGTEKPAAVEIYSSGSLPYVQPSTASLRQTQISRSIATQQPAIDYIKPSPDPVEQSETPGSSASPQAELPRRELRDQQVHRLEWTGERGDEQERMKRTLQLPPKNMQTKDRSAIPQSTLPLTNVESKTFQTTPNEVPAPEQSVNVVWRGIEPKPKTYAFWERRHLSRYRLRLLR